MTEDTELACSKYRRTAIRALFVPAVRRRWGMLLLIAVAGCSSGGSAESSPVTGIVKVDGKPAEGVLVNFWPAQDADKDSRDRYASGISDRDGRFELRTISEKAVPDGEYKVTFSRLTADGKAVTDPKKKLSRSKESLPAKYVDLQKTDVSAHVTKEKRDFTFEISTHSK